MEMNKELLAKAKNAKTVEELAKIAKENNFELNEESAKAYFELLHPQTGELADEELDNVSGGGCYKGDRLVVTVGHCCAGFTCKKCGTECIVAFNVASCPTCGQLGLCDRCTYCTYEKGLWLCNNPAKMKR